MKYDIILKYIKQHKNGLWYARLYTKDGDYYAELKEYNFETLIEKLNTLKYKAKMKADYDGILQHLVFNY